MCVSVVYFTFLAGAVAVGWVECLRDPTARGRMSMRWVSLALDPTCGASLHVLHHPLVDQMRDLEIVLLDHHHVAVAADALVLQADVLGLPPRLDEILGGAVIVDLVIGRLRRH